MIAADGPASVANAEPFRLYITCAFCGGPSSRFIGWISPTIRSGSRGVAFHEAQPAVVRAPAQARRKRRGGQRRRTGAWLILACGRTRTTGRPWDDDCLELTGGCAPPELSPLRGLPPSAAPDCQIAGVTGRTRSNTRQSPWRRPHRPVPQKHGSSWQLLHPNRPSPGSPHSLVCSRGYGRPRNRQRPCRGLFPVSARSALRACAAIGTIPVMNATNIFRMTKFPRPI
jgi:hypothetical protein